MVESNENVVRVRILAHISQVARFGISGSLALSTNVAILYGLLHTGVWYIPASIIGFLGGFVVSFTLQKFWTFRDHSTVEIRNQATRYFAILLVNLALNTILVYAFVEYMRLVPVFAQIIASLLIAIEGFFAYRFLVFRKVSQENVSR